MKSKKNLVLVVAVLGICLLSTQGVHATIQVFTDEAEFLLTAHIASTETFDGYSSGVLGTGTVVVDGITYTGQEPTWDWYITPYTGVDPPALFSDKGFGLNGGSDVLTFAGGAWTECIGFHFLKGSTSPGSSKVQWVVVATDSDGQQVTVPVLLDEPYVSYVGFIATSGIVSVSVTDVPDALGVGWAYDNVSRGEILPAPEPMVYYVDDDANGANDGSSWADAFTHPQEAMDVAAAGDQVWVRMGTYTPMSSSNADVLYMKDGVDIYGGFDGNEASLSERDYANNITKLDGCGDAWHVVVGADDARLDGFTITGGVAITQLPAPIGFQVGGGMWNNGRSPIVANCVFTGNGALSGSAMYNYSSSPVVVNCRFTGNWGGFAISNPNSSSIFLNCTFSDNSGGGIAASGTSMLKNCIFWGNEPYEIYSSSPGTVVTYSDIQGGWPGEGNIDADPCFVDPGYWDANGVWVDGDYHLLGNSQCIDAGDPNYVAGPNETDLDGKPRVIGGRVDMGAYECESVPVLAVEAVIKISPNSLNLQSKGRWITCYIWLPEDYNVAEIEPHSVLLEDEIPAERVWLADEFAVAKFSRRDVQEMLGGVETPGEVELVVSGELSDGTIFEGADTIRVIDVGGGKNSEPPGKALKQLNRNSKRLKGP